MNKVDLTALVNALRESAWAWDGRTVILDDMRPRLASIGLTWRQLLDAVRRNEDALGGFYSPARYQRAEPQAFNCAARRGQWTQAQFRFHERQEKGASSIGKPLIEIL